MKATSIMFINPETRTEELGMLLSYPRPFKAKVKSIINKKVYIIDIDDMYAV